MQGSGCRVQGAGCRVYQLSELDVFKLQLQFIKPLAHRRLKVVLGVGVSTCRVQGAGCRVQGAGCKLQLQCLQPLAHYHLKVVRVVMCITASRRR